MGKQTFYDTPYAGQVVIITLLAWRYGYPSCCINEFLTVEPEDRKDTPRKLWGSGYVPCTTCNSQYSAEHLFWRINQNRAYPTMFPFVDDISDDPILRCNERHLSKWLIDNAKQRKAREIAKAERLKIPFRYRKESPSVNLILCFREKHNLPFHTYRKKKL